MQDLAAFIEGQANLGICLTPAELAKELKINTNTAYELVHTKGFPAIQISERRWIIPRKDLIEWLSEKAKKGA